MSGPLLSIRGLCVDYITETGPVRAVDSLTLDLSPGEVLGIAGESGSGKSTLAQALLRTLPAPGLISGGEVLFEGSDLTMLDEAGLRRVRWSRIAMVFQSAMDSLNPVIPVGEQIVDAIQAHGGAERRDAKRRAGELLEMVGMERSWLNSYAHQLSGGMRQRVCIALALALKPSLVILDEPTTALDVIVEHEILRQLRELQTRLGFAVLFITHDLGRMLQFSDRVAVFYAGRLAEVGPSAEVARAPKHPYTQGLLRALPSVRGRAGKPASIPGAPPSLRNPPPGCRFHPRCDRAVPACRERNPEMVSFGPAHQAACPLAE